MSLEQNRIRPRAREGNTELRFGGLEVNSLAATVANYYGAVDGTPGNAITES